MNYGVIPEDLPDHMSLDPNSEYLPIGDIEIQAISDFSGSNPSILKSFISIIPYFTLFHSIWMRAAARQPNKHLKTTQTKSGQKILWIGDVETDERWAISAEDYNKEYQKFKNLFRERMEAVSSRKISTIELQEELDRLHLGKETAERFRRYFSGEETPSQSISGSCANPQGCVQNLQEFAEVGHKFVTEKEHSKPDVLWFGNADQKMCLTHNRWKSSNPMFDVGGMLWCILGNEEV